MTSPLVSDRIGPVTYKCLRSLPATRTQSKSLLLFSSLVLIGVVFCSLSPSDHTEIPHPSDKVAPPPEVLMQEEIFSETCQSEEPFTQSVGGLSEVPPLPAFYSGRCSCQMPPERPGELQFSPSRLIGRSSAT